MPKKGPVITLIILKIKDKKRKHLFLFVYTQGIIVLIVCDTQKDTKGTESAHHGHLRLLRKAGRGTSRWRQRLSVIWL